MQIFGGSWENSKNKCHEMVACLEAGEKSSKRWSPDGKVQILCGLVGYSKDLLWSWRWCKKAMESFERSAMIFKDSLLLWLQILDCVLSRISSFVVSGLLSVIFYFHFFILELCQYSSLCIHCLTPLSELFEVSLWSLISLKLCIQSSLPIHRLLSCDNFFQIYLLTVLFSLLCTLVFLF